MEIGILFYRYSNMATVISYLVSCLTVSIHASIGRLAMARQPIQRSAVSCEQKRDLPVLPLEMTMQEKDQSMSSCCHCRDRWKP
jgi:hypothetical protein